MELETKYFIQFKDKGEIVEINIDQKLDVGDYFETWDETETNPLYFRVVRRCFSFGEPFNYWVMYCEPAPENLS